MTTIKRACMLLLVTLFALLSIQTTAFAQQGNWTPQFRRGQHVQIDPALTNHPTHPVRFSGMEAQVAQLGQQHGLDIYVVAVERDFPRGVKIADEVMNDLWPRWTADPNFDRDKALVIVWVRAKDNPNRGGVSAAGGNFARNHGMTPARMADQNGPVLTALRKYMPQDPQNALLEVARNVNQGIATYIADEQRREQQRIADEQRREQERIAEQQRLEQERIEAARRAEERAAAAAAFRAWAWKVSIAVAVLAILGALWWNWRRRKRQLDALFAEWDTKFENANTNYLETHQKHRPFLVNQGTDWSTRFKGRTLKAYTTGFNAFADLSVRITIAKQLREQAGAAAGRDFFPLTFGRSKAIKLMTEVPITITGAQLSVEDRGLFGSAIQEKTVKPSELLADMEQMYEVAVGKLGSIMESWKAAETNKGDIERIVGEITAVRAELEKVGLTFDPYQERFDAIETGKQQFVALLMSDPLSAHAGSEQVEAGAESLKATLQSAIALQQTLTSTARTIAQAKEHVSTARTEAADYAFPGQELSEGEREELKLAATTLLNEENGNPDVPLKEADRKLADARKHLLSGELDKARECKAAAEQLAASAKTLVSTVLAAREDLQKNLPQVRENFGRLQAELGPARTAVSELKSGFLPANFEGQEDKLTHAASVEEAVDAAFAKIRQAFLEQRYLTARNGLNNLSGAIQGARDGLVEIHSRLKALREHRSTAKSTVKECQTWSGNVAQKLQTNAFTTAQSTVDDFEALGPKLRTQQADVDKDITDWPAANAEAASLLKSYKAVDAAIDAQKQAHARAKEAVQQLRTKIADARSTVNHEDTREPARNKLRDASRGLTELDQALTVPRSNWQSLGERAATFHQAVASAVQLATTDQTKAAEAREEINEASTAIGTVSKTSYKKSKTIGSSSQTFGSNVSADTSTASTKLATARRRLEEREYEKAKTAAAEAKQAAQAAHDAAVAAVAALIGAAVAAWEEEERQRKAREAEEERQRKAREADEERQRNSNNNNHHTSPIGGGDNYSSPIGGGDSYGGNVGGGGNYGE